MNVSTTAFGNRGWVAVDLANLLANARAVRDAAGGAALLPVVKADAYGLGAIPVVRALESLDPWGFAVVSFDEAVSLREAGVRRPVLVFTPARPNLRSAYRDHELRAVLDDAETAAGWDGPFHLEIDTGMGRCGVRWDDEGLDAWKSPHLEGAFTHFHSADVGGASVELQWRRFAAAVSRLPQRPTLLHAANSAAVWRLRERLNLVRPGIFLYGGQHAPDLPPPRPVISVRAPVVSLRRLHAGETVSYGATWAAARETVIGTIGIGYADGVPRLVESRAHVLLGGQRRPMVGRITMDFVMVDLGPDGAGVRVGELATIVGRDGNATISIDEFASWAQTISYESLIRFGTRMRREYSGP